MATSDRFTTRLACPCGAAVVLHWVDRAYLDSDPEIERVTGPAIKVRAKRERLLSACCDDTDILCGRCGHVLHESDTTRAEGGRDNKKPARGGLAPGN
jgi:hypothetical protein